MNNSIPFVPLLSLLFFVENSFALGLANFLYSDQELVGRNYYLSVPYEDYVYFGFGASVIYTIGLSVLLKNRQLIEIQREIFTKLSGNSSLKSSYNVLLLFGLIGILIRFLNIEALNQVSWVLTNFINCALFGMAISDRRVSLKTIIPIILQVVNVVITATYGDFFLYLLFFYIVTQINANIRTKKRINILIYSGAVITGIFILSFSQHLKIVQRGVQWSDSGENISNNINTNSGYFDFISAIHYNSDYTSRDFYEPIIFRMNQGWLVSEAMAKQKIHGKLEYGSTILNAAIDALVPRFLNPDKEKAGGRTKITKYTNLELNENTSMNIGVLGEAYINFGYYGIIFILFYGLFLGWILKIIIRAAVKRPILITVLPIYLLVFMVTGTDFVMIFNGIVKNSIVIYVVFIVAIPTVGRLDFLKKYHIRNRILLNSK